MAAAVIVAVVAFAVVFLVGVLGPRIREFLLDPRHQLPSEKDPYFNRDYARPDEGRRPRHAA